MLLTYLFFNRLIMGVARALFDLNYHGPVTGGSWDPQPLIPK